MSETDLLANARDFWNSGNDDITKKRYNPSVASLYKSLSCLCDIVIYRKIRILPSDHTDRFNLLKMHSPALYKIASNLFNLYIKSYDFRITKEQVQQMKRGVIDVAKIAAVEGFK